MRISNHRYDRDRERFDLALRLMGHHARTRTILSWTGLSEDRVRKLYRAYPPTTPRARHRGKFPHQPEYFLQTAAHTFEATTLAALLHAADLAPVGPGTGRTAPVQALPANLEQAAMFCEAFEAYRRLFAQGRYSFEHAWFLRLSLMAGEGLELLRCVLCGRLYLEEPGRLRASSCGCQRRGHRWPSRGGLPKTLLRACNAPRADNPDRRCVIPALQSG